MFTSCLEKELRLKEIFSDCHDPEAKYLKIMELGRQQPRLDAHHKISSNVVKGCQSTVYLHSYLDEELIVFAAESDALISSGLAAILIKVYSGESPETILKHPPHYIEELGIGASLTPSRANGLYSIHLRMKQDALKFIIAKEKPV
jgi:cysteine desulfuration protein SufE